MKTTTPKTATGYFVVVPKSDPIQMICPTCGSVWDWQEGDNDCPDCPEDTLFPYPKAERLL